VQDSVEERTRRGGVSGSHFLEDWREISLEKEEVLLEEFSGGKLSVEGRGT